MVGTSVKQPVLVVSQQLDYGDGKSQSKKSKNEPTSVWPCKINGCNKQFAREADLKRHQRTTKLHTQSSSQLVTCPQCDSTFTRTDALRRHQRSRHNGIIIDPTDPSNCREVDDNNGEGSSTSVSRSSSPTRTKRKRALSPPNLATTAPVQTIVTRPDASGPSSGSQSYYRHHTFTPVFVPPRTPNGTIEPSQYPIATQENPGVANAGSPITFVHPAPGYYTTSPYYRAPDGQPAIVQALPPGVVTMQVNPSVSHPHQPKDPPLADKSERKTVQEKDSIANVLDPSLVRDSPSSSGNSNRTLSKAESGHQLSLAGNFDDTGLSAAVKKALQVVLSFNDPNLRPPVASIHGEKEDEDIHSATIGLASSCTTLITDEQSNRPVVSLNEKGIGDLDIDADGEADTTNDFMFQDQPVAPESPSMIPEGIKNLINEDASTYAIAT